MDALEKKLRADDFDFYSAGTELKDRINSDAIHIMKEMHGIDMELNQRPILLQGNCYKISCPVHSMTIFTEVETVFITSELLH